MKIIELFAGIGSQTQTLKNLGIEHTSIISEIDKYAIKSYEAIHGKTANLGDITQIEKLPYADLITYSFPCQDLSVAGKQQGIKQGTRSGLLYEVERLIENMEIKPKYLLLENVKNLVGKKHKPDFDKWLKKLEELGYNNYWQVLNAKDYGVPQNRERVFCVSIRKNIDNKGFDFPPKQELKLRLKDMLEDEVDEKYYLKEEISEKLIKKLKEKEISKTIRVGGRSSLTSKHEWDLVAEPKIIKDFDIPKEIINDNERQRRVYNTSGISPNVLARSDSAKINQIVMLDIKGNEQVRRVYGSDGISPTLNTMQGGNRQPKVLESSLKYKDFRIRKLTPKECWRLQGFSDEQFRKAEKVCSKSQLYKQAGNSIVVNVLESIFENLFTERIDI